MQKTLHAIRTHKLLFFLLGLFSLAGLYYFFIITHGEWTVVADELNGQMYARTWDSFIEGRWDIDPFGFYWELFVRGGKYYIYFGVFPAVIRGLLTLFYDTRVDISRLEMFLAGLIWAVSVILSALKLGLLRGKGAKAGWILMVVLLFGSPVIFILSSAEIYHKAIMWAIALCSAFNFLFIHFAFASARRSFGIFLALGALAAAVLLTRVHMGFAPFFSLGALGFLFVAGKQKRRKWAPTFANYSAGAQWVLGVYWFLCGATIFWVNYGRSGHPFAPSPFTQYIMFRKPNGDLNQLGMNYLKYGVVRFDNVIPMLEYYFIPHGYHFSSRWPFLNFGYDLSTGWISRYFADMTPSIPLTMTAPLLIFMTVIGLWKWRGDWGAERDKKIFLGILFFANCLPCVYLLFQWGATFRYTADFLPGLSLGSMLCLYRLKNLNSPLLGRNSFISLMVLLAFTSIYVVHAATLLYAVNFGGNYPTQYRQLMYHKFIMPFTDVPPWVGAGGNTWKPPTP